MSTALAVVPPTLRLVGLHVHVSAISPQKRVPKLKRKFCVLSKGC